MAKVRKKTRIEDVRREELIQAAHRVFLEHGLAGLTTARICAEAGMSPGILAYYFKGKEHVLFEMVRYNNRTLKDDVVVRLREARTPWERLAAIVGSNFRDTIFHRAAANAWVSISGAAGTNADFARLQLYFNRRLESNLASALRPARSRSEAQDLVLTIGVMIDGLWLRKAVGEEIGSAQAVALILDQVRASLSEAELLRLGAAL